MLGALTQVGAGSASDTDILFDFIRSQEIVEAVDAKLDLRTIYNKAAPRDFFFTLGKDPSIEALTAQWNRMVQVDLEIARRHHPRARQGLHPARMPAPSPTRSSPRAAR